MSFQPDLRFEKTNRGFLHHASSPEKLAEELFLSTIVKVGSLQRAETQLSGLSCRRQNSYGDRCDGHLLILKKENPKTIVWACNLCEESGEIAGAILEANELQSPSSFFKTELVEEMELGVVFTQGEYTLLLEVEASYFDPVSERLLFSGKKTGEAIEIIARESEMETFYAGLLFLSKQPELLSHQKTYLGLAQKVKKALDWACFS
jgi:hypothetical protein